MKNRISFTGALLAFAAAAVMLAAPPVDAQDGTSLYVVHGLDLDLPADTLVTVCADGDALFEFAYGDVRLLPVAQRPLDVTVFAGSDPDCEGTQVISAPGFAPEGTTQVVVATFTGADTTGFVVFDFDDICLPEGLEEAVGEDLAALSLLYATAAAPSLFPALDDEISPEPFEFGEFFGGFLPPGDYTYTLLLAPGEPPVGRLDFSTVAGANTVLAAVGDLDAETLDILEFAVPLEACDGPAPPLPPGPISMPTQAPPPAPSPAPVPMPNFSTPVPSAERPIALTG